MKSGEAFNFILFFHVGSLERVVDIMDIFKRERERETLQETPNAYQRDPGLTERKGKRQVLLPAIFQAATTTCSIGIWHNLAIN